MIEDRYCRVSSVLSLKTLTPLLHRQLRSSLENSKGRYLYSKVISDFRLGAEDGSELQDTLDPYRFHNELLKWDSRDWVALLRKQVSFNAESNMSLILLQILYRLAVDHHPWAFNRRTGLAAL